MKPKLLVSACLLGTPCRYDGKSKKNEAVCALAEQFELIPVCPEVLGGLPTPRTPSERRGACVVRKDGRDVTAEYRRGAECALETARRLDFRASASKFVILITDAGYKVRNDYGITSMDEEISLLAADGIITSVVTTSWLRTGYQSLYESTGGIYANIYDDFSDVLMSLAELIGETTSEGTWVILQHGFKYVRLNLPEVPEAGSTADSDGDGLTDYAELGDSTTVDLTPFILKYRGTIDGYTGQTSVLVFDAASDPTRADTDGDGNRDDVDPTPWEFGLADGVVGALKICSYGTGPNSSGGFDGHAYTAYTSFVQDDLNFYGILVASQSDCAKEDDTRSDTPCYHCVTVAPDEVITLGGWAGWLPKPLRGSWINNELMLFGTSAPKDQRALTAYLTQADLDRISVFTETNSKWTYLYNCSAYAADLWNTATGDSLSARGMLGFCNPASLSYNIEKCSGYEVGGSLQAERP